jgi:galactokinase
LNIKPVDIALMGQSVNIVGINCGIMDQFSSVMGLENVIKIDHWNMNIIMLISMIIL